MEIFMNDALTTYKLIILYMLDKVDFPLTNSQVVEFVLEKEYTTYFTLQQVLGELNEAELVHVRQVRNSSYYTITDAGRETLEYFGKDIPEAMRRDADHFLKEHHYQLRSESETLADYYQEKPNLFIVRCEVREKNHPLISLSLSVTTKEQASAICDNWKKHNANVYAYLIQTLMLGQSPAN